MWVVYVCCIDSYEWASGFSFCILEDASVTIGALSRDLSKESDSAKDKTTWRSSI